MKKIPSAFLSPLSNTTWSTCDYTLGKFNQMIKHHRLCDLRSGRTSNYVFRAESSGFWDGLTYAEVAPMVKHIDAEFVAVHGKTVQINQHYIHSLEQFYGHVQKQWGEHLKRTTALIGTPAGKIHND